MKENNILISTIKLAGKNFGLNASAMRIVFILLLFLTFSAAGIAYLILWAIMPTKNAGDKYKERMQNRLNN